MMHKLFTTLSYLLFLLIGLSAQELTSIDILHSKLNLKFDWQKKQAAGLASIEFKTLNYTNKISIDAGFLTINSIKLSGKTDLKFTYDGGDKKRGLTIILNKNYPVNTVLEITIDYHTNYVNESDPNNLGGSFGKGIRFFRPTQSTPIKRKQIWSSGEPEGNKYWYPCIESLSDLRTTEFIATVENNLTVISNGNLISVSKNINGAKTFHFKTDKPYPNYLTNFIVGEYVVIPQIHEGIPFNTFCYPDEVEAAKASANRLTDMVKYFSSITGVSYPYKSYSQVMLQDYPFPSATGQNMVSTLSDNFVDDDRTHADFLYLWDGVEAEALAAQWFGNLLAPKGWNNTWLTKSFARYLDGLYNNYKNGHEEYLLWNHQWDLNNCLSDWASGIHHPLLMPTIIDLNSFLTGDNYLRSRGGLVLRMLAKEVGDENWKKVIHYFIKENAFKTVTTKDFQNTVELITGKNMRWFFNQWVYKMGQPKFEINKNYDKNKKQLQVKLVQTQKLDSASNYEQIEFFEGNMTIEIDNKLYSIRIEPRKENNYTLQFPEQPKFVNIDFEKAWIAEIFVHNTQSELIEQFEKSEDILARAEALNELANLYKDSTTSQDNKTIIYQSLLKVAGSNSYWRFRNTVLTTLNSILPKPFDNTMRLLLKNIINNEKAILKATAIGVLGFENNPDNADIFINQLNDESDRVISNAAIALGKTKSSKAFEALLKLKNKPSWKGQSVMAALTGMRFLGDERAVPIALEVLKDNTSPRWFLGASGWDYPVYAATTLASYKKGNLGYDIVLERFKKSLQDDDINDIFSNVLLIVILADERGQTIFEQLKLKYKNNQIAMNAVNSYEEQFKAKIK